MIELDNGSVVALGDGLGAPQSVMERLSDAARGLGDVRLVLGWVPKLSPNLQLDAFADVRALMSGGGLRPAIDAGIVRAIPTRLSAIPALLHGPLRPDVLVATVVRRSDGTFGFGTEVSWQWAAVDAGARIAAVVASKYPRCDAGPPLPSERITIVGELDSAPSTVARAVPDDVHRLIADRVSEVVPDDARLQIGPGQLGAAVIDALRRPVHIDSGLLPEEIVNLDRRGLLRGEPIGTYLAGGPELCDWADGRPLLHRLEYTHDVGRLSTGRALIAVNTAIEIDVQGQVNVEGLPGANLGGIGGHPDYAIAAARSIGGLSVIALPASHRDRPTLVDQLSLPVSTPSHDVDVVITEHGTADLRGLDRRERCAAIARLWP